MKCKHCGCDLVKESKFCPNCGNPVELNDKATEMKEQLLNFWNQLTLFYKIVSGIGIVLLIALLLALFSGSILKIIIVIVGCAFLIVALLTNHHKINLKLSKYIWIGLCVVFLLISFVVNPSKQVANDQKGNEDHKQVLKHEVTTPFSSIESKEYDYLTLHEQFKNAGFNNIEFEVIEDLDIDQSEYVESVRVKGMSDFTKNQNFSSEDLVVIQYHTYKICQVTFIFDFESNFLFNTYGVDLAIDYIDLAELAHGEDKEVKIDLKVGNYVLTATNEDDSSINGEVNIEVSSNMTVEYKIKCHGEYIEIKEVYVDQEITLKEGEIKLNKDISEYRYQDYLEVKKAMEDLGFTNITCKPVYDIVFGITDEGEVEEVQINQNNELKRGQIVNKDDEVVIIYHMKANYINIKRKLKKIKIFI